MPTVSVIYPRRADASFDFDYYRNTHLPLVARRWRDAGLKEARAFRGLAAPDGADPAYFAIALLRFTSPDALEAAMTGAHAGEIIGDIANFTDVQPFIQINDEIGGGE